MKRTLKNNNKSNDGLFLRFILTFLAGALIITFALVVGGLELSKSTPRQESSPGIDNDSSWIVQKTTRGYPLPIYKTVESNNGFWSGNEVTKRTEILWGNITIYIGLSLLISFILTLTFVTLKPYKKK